MSLLITTVRTQNYREEHRARLRAALNHLRIAINSVQFQQAILQHPPFQVPRNLNNRQIYDKIMSGQEIRTNADNEADLRLTLVSRHSTNAIGYTIDTTIFTFQNMFESLSPEILAGHYAHEYCHTLGFADPTDLDHTGDNVPYEVGRIITAMAEENRLEIEMIG